MDEQSELTPRGRTPWYLGRAGRRWAWTRRRVSLREAGRWVLGAVLVLVPSVVWGVATASAQASLGPHQARYELTLDGEVTVDLGPLGTVVIDSPLPLALGGRVVVQEIPREITAVGTPTTLDALGRDLESYVQFFTAPEAAVAVAVRELVLDAIRRSAVAALLLTAVVLGLRAALGPRRRAELRAELAPHRPAITAAATVAVVVLVTLAGSTPLRNGTDAGRATSAVFDGTPLEGARITGRLAGVVDTYGGYAVDAYRDNQDFYDSAAASVRAAWEQRAATDALLSPSRRTLTPRVEEVSPDGGPAPVTLLVVSDLHCNVGMVPVIRTVAELADADVILNAGDTTVNGTGVESYCVTAFAGAVPDGAEMVVADGNHDSQETAAQERDAGMVVLDGAVVEVAGVRILGDADPRATRIGVGTTLVGDETVGDVSRRLAEVACGDDQGVDLLLVHDPGLGNGTLEEGCAPAQVSGHLHRRIGPVRHDAGVRYVSGSTAGALLGRPTIGPLSGTAEMTVLRFDPESRRILDYRVVAVDADGTARVGLALRWPAGLSPVRPSGPAY